MDSNVETSSDSMHIARDNGPSYEESISLDFGIGFSLVGLVILAVVDQFLGGTVFNRSSGHHGSSGHLALSRSSPPLYASMTPSIAACNHSLCL